MNLQRLAGCLRVTGTWGMEEGRTGSEEGEAGRTRGAQEGARGAREGVRGAPEGTRGAQEGARRAPGRSSSVSASWVGGEGDDWGESRLEGGRAPSVCSSSGRAGAGGSVGATSVALGAAAAALPPCHPAGTVRDIAGAPRGARGRGWGEVEVVRGVVGSGLRSGASWVRGEEEREDWGRLGERENSASVCSSRGRSTTNL